MRHLVIVLSDQLDLDAAAFDGFDATADFLWMAEASEESTHVWSAKPRITLFLSRMRHFAEALRKAGLPLDYTRLADAGAAAAEAGLPLEVREDRHFYGTVREFAAYANGHRQLRMEFFYREMRRRHRVLMHGDARPAGGGTSMPTTAMPLALPVPSTCRRHL